MVVRIPAVTVGRLNAQAQESIAPRGGTGQEDARMTSKTVQRLQRPAPTALAAGRAFSRPAFVDRPKGRGEKRVCQPEFHFEVALMRKRAPFTRARSRFPIMVPCLAVAKMTAD
ncbi:hypothetical protein ERJ75_001314300 [Trypanosoma vivax]|nr:hypothetical protein ERJ75_001314300 [Trypanosoma vivax]